MFPKIIIPDFDKLSLLRYFRRLSPSTAAQEPPVEAGDN
jgi:hypothetical protein